MNRIILASASPRRKEILEQVGIDFEIIVSDKEEIIENTDPVEVVRDLASMKANDINDKIEEAVIIIGADTIVVHNNQIMGKPKDEEDAKRMLRDIQDDTHEVYTGVSIVIKDYVSDNLTQEKILTSKEITFSVSTKVTINKMSEEQINQYVATKEPLDKAGAYAVQGKFALYVKQLEGDYYNVVGLPIASIYQALLEEDIDLLSFK